MEGNKEIFKRGESEKGVYDWGRGKDGEEAGEAKEYSKE